MGRATNTKGKTLDALRQWLRTLEAGASFSSKEAYIVLGPEYNETTINNNLRRLVDLEELEKPYYNVYKKPEKVPPQEKPAALSGTVTTQS